MMPAVSSLSAATWRALGVILGFRNNSCYARWWEARTLWGRIVNHSRCLGRQVVAYSSVGDQPQDCGLIQRADVSGGM